MKKLEDLTRDSPQQHQPQKPVQGAGTASFAAMEAIREKDPNAAVSHSFARSLSPDYLVQQAWLRGFFFFCLRNVTPL